MGLWRKVSSWRTGFALLFMCLTTVVFFRGPFQQELSETQTHLDEIQAQAQTKNIVLAPKLKRKPVIAGTRNTRNTNNEEKNAVSPTSAHLLTIQDVQAKLAEIAQKHWDSSLQSLSVDPKILQWIAESGKDKIEGIFWALQNTHPSLWGETLEKLRLEPLGRDMPLLASGKSSGDEVCELGADCSG